MTAGTVKWFIAPEDIGRDVFDHQSAIQGSVYTDLSKGQRVEFDSEQAAEGPHAIRDLPV
jgi:cold shock CspA family protein